MLNLAPTSTGSATAIATIFPELKGKLNGLAIRVPMLNASITDCVFEVIWVFFFFFQSYYTAPLYRVIHSALVLLGPMFLMHK